MNPMHRGAHGNCTAGLYRKKLTERLVRTKLSEAEEDQGIASALRAGVDHYGEQLRGLSHLGDASPEKLRSSLLFQTFKAAKAELATKSPKTTVQDLISTIDHENIGDNFTLELGKRLQAMSDAIPDEQPLVDPATDQTASPGPSDQIEPDPSSEEGVEPAPDANPAPDAKAEEPPETENNSEVSPDEFGDLVDKLQQ